MKTAVIIPLYNGKPWIVPTLKAVFAQTSPLAEVVVVDDGSTDGSVEAVREFSGVRFLRNPGKGANQARSHGLAQVRAPYVAMLDQDDLWAPGHLGLLESLLDEFPRAAAAFSGAHFFQSPEEPKFDCSGAPPVAFDPWQSYPANRIWTPSQVLMRRDSLLETGGWCVHLPGVADVNAWFRLSAKEPFIRSPRVTVGYRRHQNSHSARLRKESRHQYLERFIAAGAESFPLRLRHHPQQGAELERRLATINVFSTWMRTVETGSRAERSDSATQADRVLAGEDRDSSFAILEQVLFFSQISALEKSVLKKGYYLLRLIRQCPGRARNLKRSLGRVLWNEVKW